MKQSAFYILWAGLFGLCAALGFIPEPVDYFSSKIPGNRPE
jgi:hypothetical protein